MVPLIEDHILIAESKVYFAASRNSNEDLLLASCDKLREAMEKQRLAGKIAQAPDLEQFVQEVSSASARTFGPHLAITASTI